MVVCNFGGEGSVCLFIIFIIDWVLKMNSRMLLLGVSLILTACASINSTQTHSHVVNNSSSAQSKIPAGHDVVYFIRGQDKQHGSVVNVFVDGHFATSLAAGRHRALAICSHTTDITVAFSGPKLNYSKIRQEKHPFTIQAGNTHYLSVVLDEDNQPQLVQISEKEGQALLKETKESVRTLPRISDMACMKKGDSLAVED